MIQRVRTLKVMVGFMLIETMIYSCLVIAVAVISLSYAVQVAMRNQQAFAHAQQYARAAAALDTLRRDLAQAPTHKKAWKAATATRHVWTTKAGDVGFEHSSHGIVRSQGRFNRIKQVWIQRTKSLVATDLSYTIQPTSEDDSCMHMVELTIQGADNRSVATTVALRSGVRV